jgi:hypothetical protein
VRDAEAGQSLSIFSQDYPGILGFGKSSHRIPAEPKRSVETRSIQRDHCVQVLVAIVSVTKPLSRYRVAYRRHSASYAPVLRVAVLLMFHCSIPTV